MKKITSQQVGKCGELLVQYHLLKEGIESSPMTTDAGIDLVAFPGKDRKREPKTIQVKTSTHHKDADSTWLLWEVPESCDADLVAIVDLERDVVWMVPTKDFLGMGTKTGSKTWPKRRLIWSTDARWRSPHSEAAFDKYRISLVAPNLF